MNQLGTIFKFELKGYLKNKVFVGVTVFLVALMAVVMFFPRVSGGFGGEEESSISGEDGQGTEQAEDREGYPVMLVAGSEEGNLSPESMEMLRQAFSQAFMDYDVRIEEKKEEEIKEKILTEDAECAFVFDSLTSYTYYVGNLSMNDQNSYMANEVLESIFRMNAMMEKGIAQEEAQEILSSPITGETESLGKDQIQNFFYTYIMIFALYMVILLYGQMVATNVATEKSSRAMELLITSAKPASMMFGKVFASCFAGFFQLVAVFGSALLFYQMNASYWGGNDIIASIFAIPTELLVYMLVFFVLGFLIYAFLFGAVGSTASKLEDINTSVMPITLLFIVGFFVVMFSMTNGSVDNLLMKVCSFVPFTSPMAMFTRIAMSTVPFYEIAISIVILIGSVLGVGVLSARIYRVGVLLYGKPPKIGTMLRSVWKA